MYDDQSADPDTALERAVQLYAKRFDGVACAVGDQKATAAVLAVADQMVAWLRRIRTLTLDLVAVREQDSGDAVPITRNGDTMAVVLDTSQEAAFDILARDDRGFLSKSALDLTVTGDNITAEVVETPDTTTPNQLVVRAVQPGAGGLVVLSVPDDDTIPDASEAFDVNPGGVESLALGTPTIREQEEPPAPPA